MCVICVKPAGIDMPDKIILNAMADHNPHGFGFATPTKLYHSLSKSSFMKALAMVKKSEPCILHFRLATHGSIKPANCHPFTDTQTGVTFAHNGILYDVKPQNDMTDSETAFRRLFVPAIKKYGYESKEFDNVVSKTIGGSKFAFINRDGKCRLFGKYYEVENCYYSNLYFI